MRGLRLKFDLILNYCLRQIAVRQAIGCHFLFFLSASLFSELSGSTPQISSSSSKELVKSDRVGSEGGHESLSLSMVQIEEKSLLPHFPN